MSIRGQASELGVYQGQASAVLNFFAEQFGRQMYLLDTFSGLAEAQYEPDMGAGKEAAFKDVTLEQARDCRRLRRESVDGRHVPRLGHP